jgi:GNAT superfamily N-acetyltransferase
MSRDAYLERTAAMLGEVFGGTRYSKEYLDWQYERSPEGREVAVDIERDGRSLAHYCVIPQTYGYDRLRRKFALSLNTAVTKEARGKGVFTQLAEDTYEKARRDFGVSAIVGVANANSTPGFLGRLKFKHLGALPVHVGIVNALATGGTQSYSTCDSLRELPRDVWDSIDTASPLHWSQVWTPELIRWRLDSPLGPYAVHVHKSGIAISTVERRAIPIAILLKMLPRKGVARINSRALLRAACRYHGTAVYLYAGFNERATIRGMPLPQKLRPSPLNLIYRAFDDTVPAGDHVKLGTFEFLDFDAY